MTPFAALGETQEFEKQAMSALGSGLRYLGRLGTQAAKRMMPPQGSMARQFTQGMGGGLSDLMGAAGRLFGRGAGGPRWRHSVYKPTWAHAAGYGVGMGAGIGLPLYGAGKALPNLMSPAGMPSMPMMPSMPTPSAGPDERLGRNGVHPDLERLWAEQGHNPNNNPVTQAYQQGMAQR